MSAKGFWGRMPLMLSFHIVTLFPEFFDSPLACGLTARAREKGVVAFSLHDPRAYSPDRHRHVDDRPYGGGPGMVMQAAPVAAALRDIPERGRILLMSPGGRPFTQKTARELAFEKDITLICGRYEGIDARLQQIFPVEPVCVGEAVLNGGETAALAVMEAVARLLPGFMGKEESGEEESVSDGLLEYPHYTRPDVLEGLPVPPVLCSGDHARIAEWRREQSLLTTLRMRPALLADARLTAQDARKLASVLREKAGRNLSFCLVHHPVRIEGKKAGTSSLTNLDIHDIARISASYEMGPFHVVTPLEDQLRLLRDIVRHWVDGPGTAGHPDRARALSLVSPAASIEEAVAAIKARTGFRPLVLASSAQWPKGKNAPAPLVPSDVRRMLAAGPVMLCLGTALGLSDDAVRLCDGQLRPLRFLSYNHLSVRSAAAILADRILGDLD